MKRSSRCPLCQISRADHDRIMTQVKLLGSRAKGYSWFCEEFPTAQITDNQFFNHFRRHIQENDWEEIELVPKGEMVNPEKLNVVIYEQEGVAIDPEVQISGLHVELLKEMKHVIKNKDKIENYYNTLLSFFKEARMQIDLIDKLKLKAPAAHSKKLKELKTKNKTLLAAIEIDSSKGGKVEAENQSEADVTSDE